MGKVSRMKKIQRVKRAGSKRSKPAREKPPTSLITSVTVVLDRTGSMESCRDQTISGFNEWLSTLKREANGSEYRLTLVKFDKPGMSGDKSGIMETEVPYHGVRLDEVQPLTRDTYVPRGLTPLYDAIGQSLSEAEGVKADRVLFVIVTDGEENASVRCTRDEIFRRIQAKQKLGTWSFVFLGANQDAFAEGAKIGIPLGNTLTYAPQQTSQTWASLASATTGYSRSSSLGVINFWDTQSRIRGGG